MGWMDGWLGGNDSLSRKAAECFQYGRYEQSIKYLDQLIANEPDSSRWLDLKGCCLSKLGRYKQAHECLEQATKLDPRNAEAWASRGTLLHKINRYDKAIDCFNKALKVSRNLPDLTLSWIWHSKGECYLDLNKFQEGLAAFEEALKIQVKAESWVKKGQCLHSLVRYEEAIKSYDEALKLSPGHAEAFLFKAVSHDKLGQSEKVILLLLDFIRYAQPDDRRVEIANARINELRQTAGTA